MNKIYKVLPKYAIIPIVASLVLNMVVYFGNRIITSNMYHYSFSTHIDDCIPFVSWWMIIYVLAYVAWVIGFIVIGRESREVCYEVFAAEQIAKLLCLLCFIVVPTTIDRPEITGGGLGNEIARIIYAMDSPDNLFPSVHCLESWICFRGAIKCKKTGNLYKIMMFVAAILVFASTVLVKQHVIMDVVGGIAVVEIGLAISKKLKLAQKAITLLGKVKRN